MKVRPAHVTTGFPGSTLKKTPHPARGRTPTARAPRGAKLATAIAYPYVAEPVRELASQSSWPFAVTTRPASPKPEKLVQVRVPESDGKPTHRSTARALDPLPPAVDVPPPEDSPLGPLAVEAAGCGQPEPCLDERTSRARIVERLWEDPFCEVLEVNLGRTTESNLYVDMDLRVANGGVFVATYQDLQPGTRVSLHITLAGGIATAAHGRVTLKRESLEAFGDPAPGVCVAFEMLSHETLALLEHFASIRTPWLIEDE